MSAMTSQLPLPVAPVAGAVVISPVVELVADADGPRVFIQGQLAYAWDEGDEATRRLAAVQLVRIEAATQKQVAAGFGVSASTMFRWNRSFDCGGAEALIPQATGPQAPTKVTDQVAGQIRSRRQAGQSMRAIAAGVGVSVGSVSGALNHSRNTDNAAATGDGQHSVDSDVSDHADTASRDDEADDGAVVVPLLADPADRSGERAMARAGLLAEATPVFTPAARVPLAGLLLAIPALVATGLLEGAKSVYGRLSAGFYGLETTLLEAMMRTLAGEPRAEGATRINPTDLGRVLGLDRGPEVKTVRRKLGQLAARGKAADLVKEMAARNLHSDEDLASVLYVDGHVRTYHGKRRIQKTHTPRLRFPAPATVETWVANAAGEPVWVVMAEPGSSLASELSRLMPSIRQMIGDDRRVLVGFDRGGWSPRLFADMIEAGFDVLTWRKHPARDIDAGAFDSHSFTDEHGTTNTWMLADLCVRLTTDERSGATIGLRQVTKRDAHTGQQAHILTSRHDLPAGQVAHMMASRWRQENYFRYGRMHMALDAHDSYAVDDDDPDRLVPNPAKDYTRGAVRAARQHLAREDARADAELLTAATPPPGASSTIVTSNMETQILAPVLQAEDELDAAQNNNRNTPARLPLEQVRPGQQALATEIKLLTHAIRMAAFNTQTALAKAVKTATGYKRSHHEAHALIRTALKHTGDIIPSAGTLTVRLDPMPTPRATRALDELCQLLNQTETIFPGTDLVMHYEVKTSTQLCTKN